jgi:hypothetical protein
MRSKVRAVVLSQSIPTILSVCPDIARLQTRELALSEAGFCVASASTSQAAWAMLKLCAFSLVVLDSECCSHSEAESIRECSLVIEIDDGMNESELVHRVTRALRVGADPSALDSRTIAYAFTAALAWASTGFAQMFSPFA